MAKKVQLNYFKRFMGLLVVMTVALQSITCFGADTKQNAVNPTENKAAYSEELKVLSALKIMDSIQETNVTRGEFAVYAAKALNIDTNATVSGRYFKDIEPNNRIAPAVHTLYERGIINGTEPEIFSPNEEISPFAAAVIMLRGAGYGQIVGDFNEYSGYMGKYRLLDGISGSFLTGEDAMRLLYRALDIKMCKIKTLSSGGNEYVIDNDLTLLEDYFDIYTTNGRICSADGISINSSKRYDNDRTIIGDVLYKTESEEIINELYKNLGVDVEAYIKRNHTSDDDSVICIIPQNSKSDIIEINARDISQSIGENLVINYYKNDKTKSVSLPKNVSVLKNGEIITDNISDALNIKSGTIKLISNGSGYGTAIVSEYDYVFTSSVNTSDKMIYTKYGSAVDINEDKYDRFRIYTADNQIGSTADLKKGVLLQVLRSGSMLEVHICGKAVLGTTESINDDYLVINSEKYDIEKYYVSELKKAIAVGKSGTFYLNNFDEICYYSEGTESSYNYGYLINAVIDSTFGDSFKAKIFSQDGKMLSIESKDKVNVDGTSLDAAAAISAFRTSGNGVIAQLVAYKVNSDGKLSHVDTITPDKTGEGLQKSAALMTREWFASGRIMMPDIALKTNGVIFQTPAAKDAAQADDKKFKILTGLTADTEYQCEGYKMGTEGFFSDVIVVQTDKNLGKIEWATHPVMVSEVYEGVDDEGMGITYVKVAGAPKFGSAPGLYEYQISEDFEILPGIPYPTDYAGKKCVSYKDLAEGDIILCAYDQDDKISHILMYFDYGNPEFSVASFRKYVNSGASDGRFVAGYALDREDNIVAMSRDSVTGQRNELAQITVAPIVYDAEKRDNKIYVGKADDIITYKETGSKASVVIPYMFAGWSREIFVYKQGF